MIFPYASLLFALWLSNIGRIKSVLNTDYYN